MIDIKNQGYISSEDRRTILQRALYSQPYFYRMIMRVGEVPANVQKVTRFAQAIGIDRDFYLTEIQSDFCEAFSNTQSLYNMSLYSGYNNSLYRYDASEKIPSAFIVTDARFRTPVALEIFDDRQFENAPLLIPKSDRVYCEIANVSNEAVGTPEDVNVILKGFSTIENGGDIDGRQIDQLNESLRAPVEWQYFKINVTADAADRGLKSYILENDNRPRLVLGFGAMNTTTTKAAVSEMNVTITEIARRLRLTDTQIPLQFIAPRLTCLLDAHLYYLPVEYYFQPYSKLQFDINNIWVNGGTPAGAEIAVLTRTV